MASKSHFIGEFRGEVKTLLDTINKLEGLRRQYMALGYAQELSDSDFGPGTANGDITKAEFLSAAQSYVTLYAFLENTHFTNLYKMKG